ncbi:MAG: hypothetical protein QG609_106 [Patescibacteria group bacterium]|nr:hypothetical protein [Patescibacteria group bacterium]
METIQSHQRQLAEITRFVTKTTRQELIIKYEDNGTTGRYLLKDYKRFPQSELIIKISKSGKILLDQATGFFSQFQHIIREKIKELNETKEKSHGSGQM